MLGLFGAKKFKVRDPKRDLETDMLRQSELIEHCKTIRDKITYERDGLSRRYSEIADDSAFLLDNIENDHDGGDSQTPLHEQEKALIIYKKRLQTLGKQLLYIEQLEQEISENFPKGQDQE